MIRIGAYVLAIAVANILTAALQPTVLGPLIIPAGSYLIGLTFILRDLVQLRFGRKVAYYAIGGALLISGITSYLLGDPLTIVYASMITFAVGETVDTEIFTRLKKALHIRVLYSGLVGGFLDSTIFVIIGLSPIGAGFVPWEAVPYAILGQMIIKFVMQAIGAYMIYIGKDKTKLFDEVVTK